MSELLIDGVILLFAAVGGTAVFWKLHVLEKRIRSIERSLGAFADLGGGSGADPFGDEQVLRHLEAMNSSLMTETKTIDAKAPMSAKEP